MNLAPIVLFVYNRPYHTKLLLESLELNNLSKDSTLYIYCDGPKTNLNKNEIEKIQQVKKLIHQIDFCKETIIVESSTNKGLANSIIYGISEIFKTHDKIIVLEDDLILGTNFLDYMNYSLIKYETANRVMQISGFQFPIIHENNQSFFMPVITTWGWGTWKRVWHTVDFEPIDWNNFLSNKFNRKKFDLNGSYPYSKMLDLQMKKNHYGSWGIRFYFDVFKKNGLTLFPTHSFIQHTDGDFSGTHKSDYINLNFRNWNRHYKVNFYPSLIETDYLMFKKLTKFYKKRKSITGILKRITFRLKQLLQK
jgi:hypothetical protein